MHRKLFVFVILIFLSWINVEANPTDSLRLARLERIIAECKDPLKVPSGIFKEIKTLRGEKMIE